MIIKKVLEKGPGFIIVEDSRGKIFRRNGGTVSWRCNNPGNLKNGPFTQNLNSVGSDHIGHAIFPTYDFGKQAQYMLLFSDTSKYFTLTLEQAIKRYAPVSDGNKPDAYIKYLAETVDINKDTKLQDLSAGQRSDLLECMKIYEGYKKGTITEV